MNERNKELAILALRSLINDIAEDRVYVLDVGISTSDPKTVDPYFAVAAEQMITLRYRVNERKCEEQKARAIAKSKHNCENKLHLLVFQERTGDFLTFKCGCGERIQVSGKELIASGS